MNHPLLLPPTFPKGPLRNHTLHVKGGTTGRVGTLELFHRARFPRQGKYGNDHLWEIITLSAGKVPLPDGALCLPLPCHGALLWDGGTWCRDDVALPFRQAGNCPFLGTVKLGLWADIGLILALYTYSSFLQVTRVIQRLPRNLFVLPSSVHVASTLKKMKYLQALQLLAAVAAPVRAAFSWSSVNIGGGGGFVPGISFHPKTKGLAYARTDIGGLYRLNSDDSWTAVTDGITTDATW